MPSAWSRLYLKDEAPAMSPGETELSAVLPVGTGKDLIIAARSLSPFKGNAVASYGGNGVASAAHQDNFFTSFSTPPLQAGAYGGGTWTFAISSSEANANANSFFALSVYVYRPSSSSVIGYIYDSDTPLGSEWGVLQRTRGGSFTGSEVTAQAGDILVAEVWRHAVQADAGSYAQTIYFNGGTDVVDLDSIADAASWIQAPQEIGFSPRLRQIRVN